MQRIFSEIEPSLVFVPYRFRDYFGIKQREGNRFIVNLDWVGCIPFPDGCFKIWDFGTEFFLNSEIEVVQEFSTSEFGKVGQFSVNGIAIYTDMFRKKFYGLITKEREIITKEYTHLFFLFSDTSTDWYAAQVKNKKWGVIKIQHKRCEIHLPFEYDNILEGDIRQGIITVQKQNNYQLLRIDDNKLLLESSFGIGIYSEGLVCVSKKFGEKHVVDIEGNTAFVCDASKNYEQVYSYHYGLARVRCVTSHGIHYGYIDTTGSVIIPPIYLEARNFSEGLAAVKTKEGWGFINVKGEFIVQPKYISACSFIGGLAEVNVAQKLGYRLPMTTNGYISKCGEEFFED
jgi:hypothetical protein